MIQNQFNPQAAGASAVEVQYVIQVQVDEPKTVDKIHQKLNDLESALQALGRDIVIQFQLVRAQSVVVRMDPARLLEIKNIPGVMSVIEDKQYALEGAAAKPCEPTF